jgi:acyl transferase domain-containing protein
MSPLEPIAMIGIGCRLPGGVRSADDLWELLVNGVDAIIETPESRWRLPAKYHSDPARPGRITSRFGGFIDGVDHFDAQFFGISPREAAAADPQQRVLLEVAYAAAEDAGLTMEALSGRRAAVYVGISGFDYGSIQLHSNEPETIDSIPTSARRSASPQIASHASSTSSARASPSTPPARRRSWQHIWPAAACGAARQSWHSWAAST